MRISKLILICEIHLSFQMKLFLTKLRSIRPLNENTRLVYELYNTDYNVQYAYIVFENISKWS